MKKIIGKILFWVGSLILWCLLPWTIVIYLILGGAYLIFKDKE